MWDGSCGEVSVTEEMAVRRAGQQLYFVARAPEGSQGAVYLVTEVYMQGLFLRVLYSIYTGPGIYLSPWCLDLEQLFNLTVIQVSRRLFFLKFK